MTSTKQKQSTIDNVIKNANTKSSAIRQLDAMGLTRSQIAKKMNIRYQHVRNVLVTPLKRKEASA